MVFDVVFPDFPGCVSQGGRLDHARTMVPEALVQETLVLHLEGMLEDGDTILKPMGLEEAKANTLCARADAFARAHGSPRSRLLLRGVREIVERGRRLPKTRSSS